MIDPLPDEGVGNRAVDVDGVPVAFAHVVAGLHAGELLSQDLGQGRVALQADAQGRVVGDEREHPPGDLVHAGARAERVLSHRARFRQAVPPQRRPCHVRSVPGIRGKWRSCVMAGPHPAGGS